MSTQPDSEGSIAGKRILVVGAGGFIGSHLVEAFLADGAIVGALDLHKGGLEHIRTNSALVFLPCDLRDSEATFRCFAEFRPQMVFHLASTRDAKEDFAQTRSAVEGTLLPTLHVLEAFRRCPHPELLVYGDSTKVYGDVEEAYCETMPLAPLSSYAIAKTAGWHFCELYRRVHHLPTASIRPTMIYGPRQSYNLITYVIESVLDGKPEISLDGGEQTRSPLFIDDAIEAYRAAARRPSALVGHAVNFSGPAEHTVRDIALRVIALMGSCIPVVAAPERKRPTEMRRAYGNNAEAARLLGWQPRTNLESGLKKTIAYFCNGRSPQGGALLKNQPVLSGA